MAVRTAVALAALLLVGCASPLSRGPTLRAAPVLGARIGRITPLGQLTEFSFPSGPAARYGGITSGPDGQIWFTESVDRTPAATVSTPGISIARMTPTGQITEFPVPGTGYVPGALTSGPGGALWFTELVFRASGDDQLAHMTPDGQLAPAFTFPSVSNDLGGLTAGPDGNLWFTFHSESAIGRITPTGHLTTFPLPATSQVPGSITRGPDGALWFTAAGGDGLGRITPTGQVTTYPYATTPTLNPFDIAAGPDGNVWFTEEQRDSNNAVGGRIGRITPSGQITEYRLPDDYSYPFALTGGPDGTVWFTETVGCLCLPNAVVAKIGRITPAGQVTLFPLPWANTDLGSITVGPDGNLWFTEDTRPPAE